MWWTWHQGFQGRGEPQFRFVNRIPQSWGRILLLTTTSGSEYSLWLLTKDHLMMVSSDILPMDQLWPMGNMVMKHPFHKLSSHCLNCKDMIPALTHSRWRWKHSSQGLSVNGAGSTFLRQQTAWNNGSEKCVLPSFIALGDLPPSPVETMWTAIFRVSLLIILADRMGTG